MSDSYVDPALTGGDVKAGEGPRRPRREGPSDVIFDPTGASTPGSQGLEARRAAGLEGDPLKVPSALANAQRYTRESEEQFKRERETADRHRAEVAPIHEELSTFSRDNPRPAVPHLQNVGPPPDQRQYQQYAMHYLAAMSLVGAFTSRLSTQSAGDALRAFGAAAEGWQTGNQQAYENGVKQWEQANKRVIQQNENALKEYELIIKDRSLKREEIVDRLKVAAVKHYDDQMYNAMTKGHLELGYKLFDMQRKAVDDVKAATAPYEKQREVMEAKHKLAGMYFAPKIATGWKDPATGQEYINPQTGQPFSESVKQYAQWAADTYPPAGILADVKDPIMRKYMQEHPHATAEELQKFKSSQYQPRSAPAIALRTFMDQFRREHGRDPGVEDIEKFQQDWTAHGQYGRTSGGMTARVEAAANEVEQLIPQAVDASKKLPRGPFVPFNKLHQEWLKGTSDERYNDFMVANVSLLNAYMRAMNPQGIPRVAERFEAHAIGLLSMATSQQAYEVQIRRLWKEVQASKTAMAKMREGVHPGDINAPVPGLDTPGGGAGGGGADPLGLGTP